jgi:RNA-directed DNA polymerase
MGIEPGLPSLPILRSEPRSGDDRVGDQRGFCNVVGGVISPLLASIDMRRFVKGWKTSGHERRLGARIVNYADDLVICCRGTAAEAMTVMRDRMSKLKLTVNETRTRTCRVPEETFDFLGHTFGRNYHPQTGEADLGAKPSGEKIKRLCREISEMTGRRRTLIPIEEPVVQINQKLRGWINYFRVGTVSRASNAVNHHVTYRLRRWLCAEHKVQGPGYSRSPDRYLYRTLGLLKLPRAAPSTP